MSLHVNGDVALVGEINGAVVLTATDAALTVARLVCRSDGRTATNTVTVAPLS